MRQSAAWLGTYLVIAFALLLAVSPLDMSSWLEAGICGGIAYVVTDLLREKVMR